MLRIAQRFAQVEYAGAQIVERGLVRGVAPKQRRQFPARLALRAQGEIGEKHAFALSKRGYPLAAREHAEFEPGKQAERPARRTGTPLAQG